jgi:hypothetical protein
MPPTQKKARLRGVDVLDLKRGVVTSHRLSFDLAALLLSFG